LTAALSLLASMRPRRRVLAAVLLLPLLAVSLEGVAHAALHLGHARHANGLAIDASAALPAVELGALASDPAPLLTLGDLLEAPAPRGPPAAPPAPGAPPPPRLASDRPAPAGPRAEHALMVSLLSIAGECPHAVTTSSGAPMKRAIVAFTIFGGAAVAQAQEAPRPLEIQPPQTGTEAPGASPVPQAVLEPVVVSAPPPAASSSEQVIPGKGFELRRQGRPADILRVVPGFVVSQHQGGGKAAQYFLRGFDADHGTDVGFFLDNMPINLRSHAHGQGYTDLHFMIPETLKQVDVFKGPYWVEYGDFSTAAAINFITRDGVTEDIVQAAGGNWGTQRYLTLLSPTRERVKTLFALEIYKTNGPFDRPQDYQRINGFAKASGWLSESVEGSIWATYLWSTWWASGQIPERAVREKLIDRFGAIDNSEGGNTQRFNLNGNLQWHVTDDDTARVRAYAQYYQLDLYSNFTFFLNDPVNGDEIGQFDRNRKVAGVNVEYEHRDIVLGIPLTTTAGFQFRLDRPNVLLTHTVDRNLLDTTQNVSIFETSYAPFLKFEAQPLPWLHVLTGARG